MPPFPNSAPLLMGLAVVVLILALAAGRGWYGWRIGRWCEREGFTLVGWRGAPFWEGPGKWLRTENQFSAYVEVVDRAGMTRSGYLVFGSRWHPFSTKIEVTWD